MPEFFIQNFWAGWAIWTALYISDYTLTLVCARLYYGGVNEKIVFEGSYELNPYFQKDIDSLRRVSPRFIRSLLLTSFLMFVIWRLAVQTSPELYCFLLGALILVQLSIHKRHFHNFAVFRAARPMWFAGASSTLVYLRFATPRSICCSSQDSTWRCLLSLPAGSCWAAALDAWRTPINIGSSRANTRKQQQKPLRKPQPTNDPRC
jgi:hypothetical protein